MQRTFGQIVRDYRKDKDLSQKEIAALIPMNQSNYCKIELDKQEPSLYQLKRISEILEVSVDKLLDIQKPSVSLDKIKDLQKTLDSLFDKFFT